MRTKVTTTIGTLLAAAALAGCGGDDNGGGGGGGGEEGLPDSARTEFVAGCANAGTPEAGCECLFDELTGTHGIDTEEELLQLQEDVQEASQQADPRSAVPSEFREAADACRDKLQQG